MNNYTKEELMNALKEKYIPFDKNSFIEENFDVLNKYINKKTKNYIVDDINSDEFPSEWKMMQRESVLSVFGFKEKIKQLTLLQKLEIIKCSLSALYFAKKYIKITSIDDGIIPFDMYEYQEEMIELFQNNRLSIALTGRQQGKTTTSASYILWYIMFHASKQVAVLANKADQAQEILERIQLSYELLPLFLKNGVKIYNKRSIVFENNSKAFSGPSSTSAIRGKSISLLYWDEASHTPNDFIFYESILPTLSSGKKSKLIMTSTPNGAKGQFYKIWQEKERNGFASIKVTWDQIPSRDEAWKNAMIAASSESAFRQEHCCEFRSMMNSLISVDILEKLVSIDPIETMNDNDLKIYKYPVDGNKYVVTVDTSRGLGKDYHVATVIDVTSKPYEIVAVYRNNTIAPLLYPNIIQNIALKYNEAFVLIEINDIGEQTANILFYDLDYENIIRTYTDKNKQIAGFNQSSKLGIRTSSTVKSIGCSTLKTMMENGLLIINDFDTINEFGTFIPKGKSFEAEAGCNDDCVMTLVLFSWLTTQSFFGDISDINIRKNMVAESYESIMPFGLIENEFGEFGSMEEVFNFEKDDELDYF